MHIPHNEIDYIFSRSSGKGGQNVNKTETRVQLRWNIFKSRVLTAEQKNTLKESLKHWISGQGDVMVVCAAERSREANLRLGVHKLTILVQKGLKKAKIRRKTRPTGSSRLKRLENKRILSLKKKSRRNIEY